MPKVSRIGDTVSVHECGVTPTAMNGSGDVYCNGISVHRVGDMNTSHPFLPAVSGCPTHSTALVKGSPNVYVNGKPLARLGDPYGCGISLTKGSPNVYSNG